MRSFAILALAATLAAAAHAADPNKVLRFAFPVGEGTFDPAIYQDQSSSMVVDQILEGDVVRKIEVLAPTPSGAR